MGTRQLSRWRVLGRGSGRDAPCFEFYAVAPQLDDASVVARAVVRRLHGLDADEYSFDEISHAGMVWVNDREEAF